MKRNKKRSRKTRLLYSEEYHVSGNITGNKVKVNNQDNVHCIVCIAYITPTVES